MRSKIIAFVVAFALIFAFSLPASAMTFSDIVGHWSQTDMEAVVERGLISGYPDNTVKPDRSISVAETITILSRLFSLSDEALQLIDQQYGQATEEIIPATGAVWARESLAICLASGTILDSEVRGGGERFNNAIKKEVLAMWLVRALLPEEELGSVAMHFVDADSIPARFAPYVAKLAAIGVLQGDEANRFNPGSDVSRAVAATMINKTIEWRVQHYGYMPILEQYADNNHMVSGIIIDYSANTLRLRGTDSIIKEYVVPSNVTTELTNVADTSPDLKHTLATLYFDDLKNVVKLKIDNSNRWAQGILTGFGYNLSTPYVTLTDPFTNTELTYSLERDATVIRNGATIEFSSLINSYGYFATVKLNSEQSGFEITLDYSEQTVSGTVDTVTYDTLSTITLMNGNMKYILSFPLSSQPIVTRGDSDIRIDRIFEGEFATVKIIGTTLTTIKLTVSEDTVSGTLTSIIRSVEGDTLIVNTENGSRSAQIEKGTLIYDGNKTITIADLIVGDSVNLMYTGLTVTEVELTKRASANGTITGTVMMVNARNYEIVIQNSGQLYYIELSVNTIILDGPEGTTLRFAEISEGDEVIVFGEYIDSTSLAATSVIVT